MSLAIAAVAWAGFHWPGAFDAMALTRAGVRHGELWRLWSGHLLHLDARHAAVNLAALAILAMIGRRLRCLPALLRASVLMMPAIALGLLLAVPTLQWYVGLSGLLHAWAAWLLLRHGGLAAAAGLCLFAVKLVWESLSGSPVAGEIPVVFEAHRIGALTGLVFAAPAAWHLRKQPHRPACALDPSAGQPADQSRNKSGNNGCDGSIA